MNTSSLRKTSFRYIVVMFVLAITSFYSPLGFARNASATTSACDTEFYSLNNILFYNECAGSTDSCSTSTTNSVFKNTDYAGNPIFTDAQLQAIESNKPFYQKSADENGIPWQLLAAIHGKETGFKRYGPSNGYGPYQITPSNYPVKDSYSDAEFQDATDKAAAFIKAKASSSDLTDPNNIKAVLFAYNGAASIYVTQAKNLGFSDAEAARGEGSPYVMNMFDEKRDPTVEPTKSNNTWGQIKQDYGGISYPANPTPGTFIYYSALTNGSLCGGSASAKNGDAQAIDKAFNDYMNSHNQTYGAYVLGVNGCTTLSSWYIGEYTNLTYGHGDGREVVANLVAKNSGKGLTITNKPVAPSLYSVAAGTKGWGHAGINPAGHVGLVVSVDEQTQTATVLETGAPYAGKADKAQISEYKYPQDGVTFVYLGDNLK